MLIVGIFKTSYGKNREEVYNRHTMAKQTAESAEASQNESLSGTDADGTPWVNDHDPHLRIYPENSRHGSAHIDVYLSFDIDDWDGMKVLSLANISGNLK